MASSKTYKRDLNRYRKVYPYIRRKPRNILMSDKEITIEVAEVPFSNSNSATYLFKENFDNIPIVTAVSIDSEKNDLADVNVFISSVSRTSVSLGSSHTFTGAVHIHAIYIAS
jgi:hypothetical protein